MEPQKARDFVKGMAGFEAMVPIHQDQFEAVLDQYAQAFAIDFITRLDTALYENNSSAHYEPTSQVAAFIDDICAEHRINPNGFEPLPAPEATSGGQA